TVLLTLNGQPRVVQMRAHAQRILEHAHIFIQRAKERFDLSGNVNGTPHPIGKISCYRNRVADGIPPAGEKLITPYPTPASGSSCGILTRKPHAPESSSAPHYFESLSAIAAWIAFSATGAITAYPAAL